MYICSSRGRAWKDANGVDYVIVAIIDIYSKLKACNRFVWLQKTSLCWRSCLKSEDQSTRSRWLPIHALTFYVTRAEHFRGNSKTSRYNDHQITSIEAFGNRYHTPNCDLFILGCDRLTAILDAFDLSASFEDIRFLSLNCAPTEVAFNGKTASPIRQEPLTTLICLTTELFISY